MRSFLLLAMFLLIAPAAQANQIYRWVDEHGVTNYTNDASKVPAGAKVETTEGDEVTVVASDRGAALGRPATGTWSVSTDILTRDERAVADQWRATFRDVHTRIAQLELALRLDQQTLQAEGAPFRRNRRRTYYASLESGNLELQQRIEWNVAELRRARAELQELERVASREAIPREWRQP
jgi:Domain of unknown function (DUF4124)